MSKFSVDAPVQKVIDTLEKLGFEKIRVGNHIAMLRRNPDGTKTPLTIPKSKNQPFELFSLKQESQERIS